ncbi:TonB-dependent receptor domain-containing protein [Massilia sp. 9096]|uniref:TonB-dependent receptor domain-containing protein n=1 Tax=Massilia sp. 9096 TaxID=1500894 RepID=UPI00055C4181|nr:TonB-dependent receptor [Massilia sp. 9096]
MKLKKLVHLMALIGVVGPAAAQNAQPDAPMQRVEITGSSIRRLATEGALPVQTITLDQMDKQGVTNAEEMLRLISSNGTGADNMTSGNNVFGADADRVSGGGSFASMRGLGPTATLVLINGQRISGYGMSAKAVDLNTIPLAAIARVEVLKDGASAIYGTDAVGGVINFILKTDFEGIQAGFTGNWTQHGGGDTRRLQLLAGKGNLDRDGFNVMAAISHSQNQELDSRQRSFANGYQPARGLSPDTTGTPVANQLTGAGSALGVNFTRPGDPNKYLQAGLLSLQGKCDSVPGMMQYNTALWKDVTSPLRSTYSCAYDYGADYVMQLPVERTNGVARATYQINPDNQVYAEVIGANTRSLSILTPVQVSATLAAGNAYPAGGPYYQNLQPYIPSFDPTKPILYKWRAWPLGNRTQQNVANTVRVSLGAVGTIAGKYDYKINYGHSESHATTDLLDGYAYTTPFYKVLGSGIVNPFAAPSQGQSDAAMAALNATKFYGEFQHGKTTLDQINASISGPIWTLPAGDLQGAIGTDLRQEGYGFAQNVDATQILLAPGNANFPTAHRSITALYAELVVPVIKNLELQLALRTDKYQTIGSTTNPKIAFSYRPVNWLMLRGSANKGFLAPSFNQLYSGRLDQELPNGVTDPVGCASHPNDPRFCAIERLSYFTGGNPNLRPETSKQGTLGFVIEPTANFSASVDYWAINTKDHILNRTPQVVLANSAFLAEDIIRNTDDTIDYVNAGWINAGGIKTRGADLGLRGRGNLPGGFKWNAMLDGTWTQSYKVSEIPGMAYTEEVGSFYTRDIYLRWKTNATFAVSKGDWSVMVNNLFRSGYNDELPDGGKSAPPPGFNPRVASYTTWGLTASYTGIKNTSIDVGIQNLFDRQPSFTAHNVDEVVGAGWDPRVADPRLRSLNFDIKYKF